MRTDTEENIERFVEAIHGLLKNELALNPETVHFIDSTFPVPSVNALGEMMAEADGEEEILYSLIFFPDEAFQEQLEELLESMDFSTIDEEAVVAGLVDSLPVTPVRFPDGRGTLHLRMPRSAAGRFLSRLNISRKINDHLADAIQRHLPATRRLRVRVKLRNARFAETENRISFLCRFFETLKDDAGRCIDFVLGLFEESSDGDTGDVYETLKNKKRFFFQNIQKAKRYREMLEKDNIETLLLRGVRIPHIDVADAEAKMDMIDRINGAVYGKTEYLLEPRDVVEFNGVWRDRERT